MPLIYDLVFVCGLWLLASLLLGALWVLYSECQRGSRARRRGGYMDLRSRVSSYTNPRTVRALGTSTGCKPGGLRLAAPAGQGTLHPLSRGIGSGFSTNGRYADSATDGSLGYLTPRDSAA